MHKITKACAIDGCDSKIYARGYCSKHYTRLRRHGSTTSLKTAASGEPFRLLKSVVKNPPGQCVIWPYAISSGYGIVWHGKRTWKAHRLALVLFSGENPEEKEAAHGPCHNRACINPLHLSWKSTSENARDRVRDGTENRGERQGGAKLTEDQVLSIYRDDRPYKTIAREYVVCDTLICKIKKRRRWGWLTEKQDDCAQ